MSIATEKRTTVWNIDPAHTQVEVAVKHMMITTVRARFSGVEGQLVVDENDPENSRAEVKIDASTIDTRNDDRDQHLRSEDFLHVEEHPYITFESKRIEGAHDREGEPFQVIGDLTIRGETREVTLDATYEGTGTDPWGGTRAGFTAQTEIDRRDFGLTWNQALETGGVLVANKLRIELEVQAVKQENDAS